MPLLPWTLLPSSLYLVLLLPAFAALALLALYVALTVYGTRLRAHNKIRRRWALNALATDEDSDGARRTVVGFFHPYSNAGGGGERVLWTAVACLQREERDVIIVVYTGDLLTVSKDDLIFAVAERFGISLDPSTLLFVPLHKRYLIEAKTWPRFTLLGQSLGSVVLAFEAMKEGFIPDLWIDTMGYAFTYPLVKLLCRVPVGSYTHYPTISSDMLRRVRTRQEGHTNTSIVARSWVLTEIKLLYYRLFTFLYAFSLRHADVLLVNSSWTQSHLSALLQPLFPSSSSLTAPSLPSSSSPQPSASRSPVASTHFFSSPGLRQRSHFPPPSTTPTPAPAPEFEALYLPKLSSTSLTATLLYPPCDTDLLSSLPLGGRERIILSVAQFRPEKEHGVQLEALALFLKRGGDSVRDVRMVVCGSVRNPDDEERVRALRKQAVQLGVQAKVQFVVNASYPELVRWFAKASVGLHTMVDEHFGITVVEFMAAGLIPLAHASAGPLLDIVVPFGNPPLPTGFHATSPSSFADRLLDIFSLSEDEARGYRERARRGAVERLGKDEFEKGWMRAWLRLCLVPR